MNEQSNEQPSEESSGHPAAEPDQSEATAQVPRPSRIPRPGLLPTRTPRAQPRATRRSPNSTR